MYTLEEYNNLTARYGAYASWAVWDYKNESDTSVIAQHIEQLHSHFVFVGLNVSSALGGTPWTNFHGGRHDRKLKYACNDTLLRGSYITDIFKDVVASRTAKLGRMLTEQIISTNIQLFMNEMEDIKVSADTTFIVLSSINSALAKYFNRYVGGFYKNRVIFYTHYSNFKLTDKEWVTGIWDVLGMDHNYEITASKYRRTTD